MCVCGVVVVGINYMYNCTKKALFSSCRLCRATLSPYTNNIPKTQNFLSAQNLCVCNSLKFGASPPQHIQNP